MDAIRTQKLTKFYGKSRGMIDVSLSVAQGEMFGFIGPNGAGKSTTIRTLLGLISPTSGSAAVLGWDIARERTRILANVGYLPSEAAFYGGMKVSEVLKLSADLHKKDCSAEAKRLCEMLELDPTRKVSALSLGNRKKVAIVCAMQHKPALYIMDEPTGGLDPLMQRAFFALLQERNQEGATVFLSSHILSEVQKYCKRAAVIRDGRILACDTVENLGHTGAKRVVLHGVTQAPDLSQIRDVAATEDGVSFLYGGDVQVLVQALSTLPLRDLSISEPDLEEVFMHYYAKEADAHDDLQA